MAFRRKLQIADGSKSKGRYRRSAKRIGAVAVCLGLVALLLLGVIIAMLGHYIGPCRGNDMEQASDFSACPNLKLQFFQLQGSYNTSLKLKNQLDTALSFLTEEKIAREVERDALKVKHDAFKSDTEYLQGKQQQLKTLLGKLGMGCQSDMWSQIGAKCYYISKRGIKKKWDQSQSDCESRGGQLAIVKTEKLLMELSYKMSFKRGWIGLSGQYSVWKWVDRTDASHQNMWLPGYPEMYSYKQSCAMLTQSENNVGFRDQPCDERLEWICEKDI